MTHEEHLAIGCQTPTRTGPQEPSRVALTPEHMGAGIRHGLVNETHVPGQDRVHLFPAESLRTLFVEGVSLPKAARRFGYAVGTPRNLREPGAPFFLLDRHGKSKPSPDRVDPVEEPPRLMVNPLEHVQQERSSSGLKEFSA